MPPRTTSSVTVAATSYLTSWLIGVVDWSASVRPATSWNVAAEPVKPRPTGSVSPIGTSTA